MRLIMGGLSDNKCIEDIHRDIRKKQKAGPHQKLSLFRVQKIVSDCKVIDERQWRHSAQVDREAFTANFRGCPSFSAKKLANAKANRLPQHFSRILGKGKLWKTLSERNLVQSAAAWAWTREYKSQMLSNKNIMTIVIIKMVAIQY